MSAGEYTRILFLSSLLLLPTVGLVSGVAGLHRTCSRCSSMSSLTRPADTVSVSTIRRLSSAISCVNASMTCVNEKRGGKRNEINKRTLMNIETVTAKYVRSHDAIAELSGARVSARRNVFNEQPFPKNAPDHAPDISVTWRCSRSCAMVALVAAVASSAKRSSVSARRAFPAR